MARLTLRLLGLPVVELDGQPVALNRHKALALLAYLAVEADRRRPDATGTVAVAHPQAWHGTSLLRL